MLTSRSQVKRGCRPALACEYVSCVSWPCNGGFVGGDEDDDDNACCFGALELGPCVDLPRRNLILTNTRQAGGAKVGHLCGHPPTGTYNDGASSCRLQLQLTTTNSHLTRSSQRRNSATTFAQTSRRIALKYLESKLPIDLYTQRSYLLTPSPCSEPLLRGLTMRRSVRLVLEAGKGIRDNS